METWPKFISLLVLPPASLMVAGLIAMIIAFRWRLQGLIAIGFIMVLGLFISLPSTGKRLMEGWETRYSALNINDLKLPQEKPEAIVILAGGKYTNAPEFGSDTTSTDTLARVRFGALLHRATSLPILVSGGLGSNAENSEAHMMARVLTSEYGIRPKWMESFSANTMENAVESEKILGREKIRRVILVTHAHHMPRAIWAFTQAGLLPTAAPVQFTTLSTHPDIRALDYFPSARGMALSSRALRERMALVWYKIRYDPVKLAEMKTTVLKSAADAAKKEQTAETGSAPPVTGAPAAAPQKRLPPPAPAAPPPAAAPPPPPPAGTPPAPAQ